MGALAIDVESAAVADMLNRYLERGPGDRSLAQVRWSSGLTAWPEP
jgi:hypothetical protein